MELKEIINKVLELKLLDFKVFDFRNQDEIKSTNYHVSNVTGRALFEISKDCISVIFVNGYKLQSLSLLKELKAKFPNHTINQKVI